MGLFKRRENKAAANDNAEKASIHSARNSNSSLQTPMRGTNGLNPPTSIAEIPIPRAPDPTLDPAAYLRSIHAVRERSRIVLTKAKNNRLNHFDVDMSKFRDTADYVVSIIKVCYKISWKSFAQNGAQWLTPRQ